MLDQKQSDNGQITAITGSIDHTRAFHVFPKEFQPFRSSIIAYAASLASTLVGFPMDTVKTRMQTHKNFKNYLDCIRKTYRAEGTMGFFRGIWAPLISTSFSKSISVSLFTLVKPYTYNALYGNNLSFTDSDPFIKNIPVCFVSGFIAGGGVSLFACPFEYTKIYAQLEKLLQNKTIKEIPSNLQTVNRFEKASSTLHIVKQVLKYDGISGLYSGYKLHLMRDSIATGFYYSIYESMKWGMNELINSDPSKQSPISVLLAGGISGVFSWAVIFPVDTTKSLVQKDAVTNILRKSQGLDPLPYINRKLQKFNRRAYRGLGISVTRSFIVNMVFFSAFELGMIYLA